MPPAPPLPALRGERAGVRGSTLLGRDFLEGHCDERTQGDENIVSSSYRLDRLLSKVKSPSVQWDSFNCTLPDAVALSRTLSASRTVPGPVPRKWPPLTLTLSPLRKERNGERGRKNREFSFESGAYLS